jgi:hypothetical protein
MMEIAVVEKLLAGAGEVRDVMAADQAGKGFVPANGEALELFEKLAV